MSNIDQDNFFFSVIKAGFPNAKNLRKPGTCSEIKPIFLVDTRKRGPIVCKFVAETIAKHDKTVSNRLVELGFSVPKIDIHVSLGQWYEVYEYNPNPTLTECIKEHIDDEQIFRTYKQVLDFQAKLANCNLDEISLDKEKYFSEIYKTTAPATRSRHLTTIYTAIIKLVSRFHNVHFVHCDLKPNNILCKPDGNMNQIIDMAGIGLASEEFAMISLLESFPLPDKADELMDYYDKITNRTLDRNFVCRVLKLVKQKQHFQSYVREIKKNLSTKTK